jgi:hypothetical protein
MLTAEERNRYSEMLKHPGNRTRSELCRELNLSYLELSRVLAELGMSLPPARRDPNRMNVSREKLDELVRAGLNRSQIQITLGLSNRGLMRLLKQYELQVLSPAQRNRQLEIQGQRQCIECRQIKLLATDFYNDRTNPLGKNRRCKECLNRWSVWHRHQAKLPEPEREKNDSRTPWADQGMRRCRRCHQVKALQTEFPASPNERGGRSVCCRACQETRQAQATAKRHAQELSAQGMRCCTHCRQVKPLATEFGVNRRDPMGHQTRCRACQQEVNRSKRNAVAHARSAQADPLTTAAFRGTPKLPTPNWSSQTMERPTTGVAGTPALTGGVHAAAPLPAVTAPQTRPQPGDAAPPPQRPALPGDTSRAAA